MKIFFDHQTFSQQAYGGISRYYTELIVGINKSSNNSAYLPLLVSNNVYLKEMGMPARAFFPDIKIPKKLQAIDYLNKQLNIYKLSRKEYDIFHPTYYDSYFLPYLKGHPYVVTFLDMIHEKFGSDFRELAYDGVITEQKRLLANHASRIIAISESTKQDIVNILDINPDKIDVIYLGSSFNVNSVKEYRQTLEMPYLLFVGNRSMYKNFIGLLKAIHPLLKKYKIKLICAGGELFSKTEIEFMQSLKISDLVERHAINDKNLPFLYQNALAFVFPSLYEGFGIPVLEAFACQCPCILSNTSSLPEVADDAARYFDPHSIDDIARAIEEVITDEGLRQSLILKGSLRLSHFSWSKTVNETLQVYDRCLSL